MEKKTFTQYSIFFGLIYFLSINGLSSIYNLPLSFMLKENLALTATQMAYFGAVTTIAWVIKPVWGFISDYFPILGYRRKSYLLLTSVVAFWAWVTLAFSGNYTVLTILTLITISYVAYAFQDVVTDGLMVEVSKPDNLTGKFQSIQWGAVYAASIITALASGYLTDLARNQHITYQHIFGITAIFPLITIFVVWYLVKEPKIASAQPVDKTNLNLLKESFKHKDLWLLAFFLFFWNFSPSFGAPFFYYATDTLKFDGKFFGILGGIASASSLLGAILFNKYLSKIEIRKLLVAAIFIGIGATLFTLIYFVPQVINNLKIVKTIAIISSVPLALISTIIFLSLLNLAAKISPLYAGGTVFAFLMSFYNLGIMGSSIFGGWLFQYTGLIPLIIISAVFSFFTIFLLPYLTIDEKLTKTEQIIKRLTDKLLI